MYPMSTKVYNAYRLLPGVELWEFVHMVRPAATKAVQAKLRAIYTQLGEAVKTDSKKFKQTVKEFDGDKQAAKIEMASTLCRKSYREQAGSSLRDFFDFDVSLAFRQYKGRVYMQHFADMQMRDVFDFFNKKPWTKMVEDYHFQNQADKPPEILEKDWRERERIYDAIDELDLWKDALVLTICDNLCFYQIDPKLDMLQQLYRKHKKEKSK